MDLAAARRAAAVERYEALCLAEERLVNEKRDALIAYREIADPAWRVCQERLAAAREECGSAGQAADRLHEQRMSEALQGVLPGEKEQGGTDHAS